MPWSCATAASIKGTMKNSFCLRVRSLTLVAALVAGVSFFAFPPRAVCADDHPKRVDANGTVYVPALAVPLSNFLSPEARKGTAAYFNFLNSPAIEMFSLNADVASVGERRKQFAAHFEPILERAKVLYPTQSTPATMGGVYVDVIVPKAGIAPKNKDRVLINLHGGGFVMGARVMGALESVPVAALGRIKVVTVDYREGPENKFPAASEDATAVYRELLKTYKASNIGIYGCSAGGVLTAETVAWIAKEKLARPGAVGIFCASAGGWAGGDSAYLSAPLIGMAPSDPTKERHPSISDVAYFSDADFNDPLVAPASSPSVMARFPPTLILTSTRDAAASSAVHTHALLVKAGVDAELHMWEGLPHGFFTFEPDFPESREAWDAAVKFFDRHLGEH